MIPPEFDVYEARAALMRTVNSVTKMAQLTRRVQDKKGNYLSFYFKSAKPFQVGRSIELYLRRPERKALA